MSCPIMKKSRAGMISMSKKGTRLPKYVCEYVDRHGKMHVYLRRPGQRKIPLHGSPWSPAFMIEYSRALYGDIATEGTIKTSALPVKPIELQTTHGTWKWLCQQYMASAEFKNLTGTTPATRRRILESTWVEPTCPGSSLLFGEMPIHKMTHEAVLVLRDRKAKFKTAANDRRKIIGYVFRWGMNHHRKLVLVNPVRDVDRLKHKVKNVPPWSEDNFHTFMQKYPPGSKPRRAMALHLYTGARGGDARLFGPQHVKNGRFSFTQQKTGGEVDIPVLEELARELALAPKDALAYILTEYGSTFSQKGYGTWFNDKCRKAGLVNRTAHGIRAGAATIAANNGASVHQLMSMFGWMSESMAIRYTRKADRKKLADTGMQLVRLEQKAL
jgi:integrase